ncbi:MAG TPA: hypothetical protein PLT82_04430 [Candidatus Hydrogenedens sp.]|nr:zinc-ribbon domain-containing protein [Candidatus Hydrogenedens sp.]HOK08602.1 hypothetical protein [Candidatus Hydrogenedens sp.]HOL20761.1 hypothetical protein [Candidatus Hydrogenedens sp.]HPP58357.1 hypothetical protein [Candidatus Hydrogenedens sp.]
MIICPHCNKQRIGSGKLPPDVVMILPCPACHEFSIVFRNRAIPINRHIIEKGSRKERIEHLASIVEMFLELAMPDIKHLDKEQSSHEFYEHEEEGKQIYPTTQKNQQHLVSGNQLQPISADDVKTFIEKEINSIDDPEFFKKYFGDN